MSLPYLTIWTKEKIPYHVLRLFLICAFGLTSNVFFSQTVLLSPTGDGGFDDSNDFRELGWSVTASATLTRNQWVSNRGAYPGFSGRNCAYIIFYYEIRLFIKKIFIILFIVNLTTSDPLGQ